MKSKELLKSVGINPNKPVLLINAEEALENLAEAIEEYCPNLKIEKMPKKDFRTLLNSYADCVINYHPEGNHQERAVLLRNFEMLKHYGMTDDDYEVIDFC